MRLQRNLKSCVFPHPVSPMIMTGILHLKRMIIAKILMTLSAVRTYEGSGSFTAWRSNPITAASLSICSFLNKAKQNLQLMSTQFLMSS